MYDDRSAFCAFTFMDIVFVIGGITQRTRTDSCLQFDTKYYKWKEVARMNNGRSAATCAVFEERIVVSGGWDNNFDVLNSVQSYDVAADTWSPMPNLIERRTCHSSVVVKRKLFVIGGRFNNGSCEVYNSISTKFVTLKFHISFGSNNALSIGTKIIIFQNNKPVIVSYDVDKDEWSEEPCEAAKLKHYRSCVKLPKLHIC